MGYDRGPNTFSPEGRLFQVEYAIEAIKLGSTAIGIQTSEGVILAVEKRITSPLMEPTSIEKIVEIDSHIACAFSGLAADSKTLIDKARVESQNHWFTYDEKMQVESVAQAVSNLAIQFGDSDDDAGVMSRPFGVAILFAGLDDNGPQLYHMDPSGTYLQFDARAIGSGSFTCDVFLLPACCVSYNFHARNSVIQTKPTVLNQDKHSYVKQKGFLLE